MTHLVRILLLALLLAAPLAQAGKPGGGGTTNLAPRVALTWPGAGMTLPAGSDLALKAEAVDLDGSIARVDFYQGTTLLASVAAPPYQFLWPAIPAGTHSLSAQAADNAGGVSVSTAVTLSVGTPGVAIATPANGALLFSATATVSGTYTGAADSTVLIDNGVGTRRASLNGNTYSADIPLDPGSNTLTVSVARSDQTSTLASVVVTRAIPPLLAFTAPPNRTFDAPAAIALAVDALSPNSSIAKVDFYQGSALLGTRTAPPYALNWNNVAKGTYTVAAKATDAIGQTATASLPITVVGPNLPPTVTLTSPAANTPFAAPATISLAASAADSDGTITQVAFYQNGSFLSATNVSPYAFTWSNVIPGSYTLTAQATDDRGATTTSAPVAVTVKPPSAPPTVALTAPASGASYASGATITLAASASDPDGLVAKVDFYQGGTLIGSSTQTPYTAQWTTLQAGSYTLTATATDDTGVAATSAPVTVSVVKSTITYTHNDLLGSPIAATDEDGNVLWQESYKPYGERLNNNPAAAGERQWYTGKPQDQETGLSYYGARYYDPAIGRFMGVDAADFSEKNLHSFNRYAYGNNNPYRFVDPDGNQAVPFTAIAPPPAGTPGFQPVSPNRDGPNGYEAALGIPSGTPPSVGQQAWHAWNVLVSPITDAVEWGYNLITTKEGSSGGTRAGKPFTPKGKSEIDAENAGRNDGVNVCENCGVQVVPGQRSQRGVRPPGNERQRDHIVPQSKGGDGDASNGQILCRECNLTKSDN